MLGRFFVITITVAPTAPSGHKAFHHITFGRIWHPELDQDYRLCLQRTMDPTQCQYKVNRERLNVNIFRIVAHYKNPQQSLKFYH